MAAFDDVQDNGAGNRRLEQGEAVSRTTMKNVNAHAEADQHGKTQLPAAEFFLFFFQGDLAEKRTFLMPSTIIS